MSQSKNIRLSVDIPAQQHIHLKMLATKKGVSMREYILDALAKQEAMEEDVYLDKESFRSGLKKVLKERKQLIKNLSGK